MIMKKYVKPKCKGITLRNAKLLSGSYELRRTSRDADINSSVLSKSAYGSWDFEDDE